MTALPSDMKSLRWHDLGPLFHLSKIGNISPQQICVHGCFWPLIERLSIVTLTHSPLLRGLRNIALLGQIHIGTVGYFSALYHQVYVLLPWLTHKNIAPDKEQQQGVYFLFVCLFYVHFTHAEQQKL